MAYYPPDWTSDYDQVVLVEDQISAVRAAYDGFHAVALLGTNLDQEVVRAISMLKRPVVIALDADATDKAFKLAKDWGMAFKSCRVAVLPCDLKDMDLGDYVADVIL
jgi:DNA primase